MFRNHSIIAILLISLACVSCTTPQPAAGPRWVLLGERTVNWSVDHDVIPVTAAKGTFTALKFKVMRAPIHLLNVKITYGNGADHNFVIGRSIPAGSESKVFNLPGDRRIIKKITFNYKTPANRKLKALVKVFGRK